MPHIFLAEGFEEVEALTTVDLLRRAGIEVVMTSITGSREVTGAHGITVKADVTMDEAEQENWKDLILPGGMPGTNYLGASRKLAELLLAANEKQNLIAAICAAPSVLGDLGILKGRKAACYPGFEERLSGAEVLQQSVIADGHIITSRGVGTAIDFSLAIIAWIKGEEEAKRIAESILIK